MKDLKPFVDLEDVELLACCLYGEARNQGLDGMLAVGSVVMNRVRAGGWYGTGIKAVVLKPKQFSCFNDGDPNRATLEHIAGDFRESLRRLEVLKHCHWIARGILEGQLTGNVGSATHYHTRGVDPVWNDAMRLVVAIKDHVFFETQAKKRG